MIPLFRPRIAPFVTEEIEDTINTGCITQGPKVKEFEALLADYIGYPTVLTTNSGTSAIELALTLSDVNCSDYVVTTPMTCAATVTPIVSHHARPLWADVDECGNVSAAGIIEACHTVTQTPKACIAVHWGGYPCDMDTINEVCSRRNISVIEDAAHAFGSVYHGRHIGDLCKSDTRFVCFSFQAIKHLTTVDGGALICRNQYDYDRGKKLRWFGIDRDDKSRSDFRCEVDIEEAGYKYHMNDVAATIGMANWELALESIEQARANAEYYDSRLADLRIVARPPTCQDRLSSYWLYTLRVKDRPSFMESMIKAGIQVSKVHSRLDTHTAFVQYGRRPLPRLNEFSAEHVAIPVGWWVGPTERSYIADRVCEWAEQKVGS